MDAVIAAGGRVRLRSGVLKARGERADAWRAVAAVEIDRVRHVMPEHLLEMMAIVQQARRAQDLQRAVAGVPDDVQQREQVQTEADLGHDQADLRH